MPRPFHNNVSRNTQPYSVADKRLSSAMRGKKFALWQNIFITFVSLENTILTGSFIPAISAASLRYSFIFALLITGRANPLGK